MTFGTFQIALLSVTLLLSGYIASGVLAARRARRRESTEIEFFRWLALGAVCNAPWVVLAFLIAGDQLRSQDTAWAFAVDHRVWIALVWLFAVFLWPVIVGEAFTRVQGRPPRLIRRYVGSQSPASGATAWDSKFIEVNQRRGDWVLVLLVDGGWIAGELAEGSYASIEPGERDLYVSKVHYTSLDDEFPGLGSEGGILILADQIRLVRFWD